MIRFSAWYHIIREHPILIVYALGLACVLSFGALVKQAIDIKQSTAVSATIIGAMSSRGGFHYPELKFTMPDGERIEAYALKGQREQPVVGAQVTAYVDPADRYNAVVIKDFSAQWLGKLIAFGLTLPLTIACIIGISNYRAKARQAPARPDAETLTRHQRGLRRYELGDFAGAVEEWNFVLAATPSGPAHEWRGDAWSRLGERRRAMADYRQAAKLYLQANDQEPLRRAIQKAEAAQS